MDLVEKNSLTLDSREVAEMVKKDHSNLLRDISVYKVYLSQNSTLNCDHFFLESAYQSGTGKNYKCYQITKKGCDGSQVSL